MKSNAAKLSAHYEDLLYRYALRFVKHKLVAIIIVEEIGHEYAEHAHALDPKRTREYLRMYTLEKCLQWLEAKENVLNATHPKKPT